MKSNGNIKMLTTNYYMQILLVHANSGANSFAFISGVSTIGTAFTVVSLPISTSLGVVSTVSTCVGGILLLTSK